ncbi:MAG: ABC transporter substrate-binding protein [Myxococcales bacterium]|nr:ABC transporter substrate-binding protein [Myxococcales bacterium]
MRSLLLALRRLGSLALVPALFSSCSLGTVEPEACRASAECRAAFGFGHVCGDGGFCREGQLDPRCTLIYPDDLLADAERYRDAIVIGAIQDLSLETHRARANAVQLAVIQARELELFEGRQVALVACTNEERTSLDRLTREEASVRVAEFLVHELDLPAIIGPASSGDAVAVFEALEGSDTLLISPSATSTQLSELEPTPSDEAPGLLWRTAPPDALQGRVIAQDMIARGIASVAVVAQLDPYGAGLATVFEAAFAGAGRSVTRLPYDSGTIRDSHIVSVASGDYDEMLFISSSTQEVAGALRAAELGWPADRPIFLTDSAANQDLFAVAASASSLFGLIRGTRPGSILGPAHLNFVASYSSHFADDPSRYSYTAHAFDAAWLALFGHFWAQGRLEPYGGRSLAKGLRHLSAGEPLNIEPSSLGAIATSLRMGVGVDLRGASGELDYDPNTEETSGAIDLWVISGAGTAADPWQITTESTVQP